VSGIACCDRLLVQPNHIARRPDDALFNDSGNQAWIFGGAAGAIALLAIIGVGIWLGTEGNQAGQPETGNPAAATAQPGEPALEQPAVASQDNATWVMPPLPQPAAGAEIEPGVLFSEVSIQPGSAAGQSQPGHRGKFWLYLPKGQHPAGSLPCILIAGAGSNLITGMDLGDGDRREHLPYARAGFAVLAYELGRQAAGRRAIETRAGCGSITGIDDRGGRSGQHSRHNRVCDDPHTRD
jgi:hypothetical protein